MDSLNNPAMPGVSLTIGSGGVICTLFGMSYEALVFGLFGSLLLLANSDKTSRTQAMTNVLTGVLIAGVGSPILTEIVLSLNSVMEKVGHDNILRASAMAIGAGWHACLPMILSVARTWLLKEKP